jgi:hypothetical protein
MQSEAGMELKEISGGERGGAERLWERKYTVQTTVGSEWAIFEILGIHLQCPPILASLLFSVSRSRPEFGKGNGFLISFNCPS